MGFRYRPGLGLPYERQGEIYFSSRNYRMQSRRTREKIQRLCRECGGEHWEALFQAVTTGEESGAICRRYFISRATLYRMIRSYYRGF